MNADEKVNVLLVDDQPGKLLSYEVMLAELGENLIKTSSAKEALEVLLKTDIAVILVDVCMPEFDGFELARMIRDHPRYQRTAIIFISAIHISEADSLRGYKAGAVDYVPVPVVPEVLRAKVKVFAELYRTTRMLEELNRELERRVAARTAALEDLRDGRLVESEQRRTLALAAGNMGSWEYSFAEDSWSIDEGQYRIFGLKPDESTTPTADLSARCFVRTEDWQKMRQVAARGTSSEAHLLSVRVARPQEQWRGALVPDHRCRDVRCRREAPARQRCHDRRHRPQGSRTEAGTSCARGRSQGAQCAGCRPGDRPPRPCQNDGRVHRRRGGPRPRTGALARASVAIALAGRRHAPAGRRRVRALSEPAMCAGRAWKDRTSSCRRTRRNPLRSSCMNW